MKKNLKRVSALLLAAAMAISCFAGCGGSDNQQASNNQQAGSNNEVAGGNTEQAATNKEFSYPVQTDVTVTYWAELNGNVSANYTNLGDTAFGKNLQEQTGIKIEFQHPAVGQTSEAFNLLLGKTELPDIIEYNWLGYSGGPEKAIKDGVIIALNDVIDQYCPNLKAI